MVQFTAKLDTQMISGRDFYVTGGTLRPDAPSYVERQADKDLCEGLLRGEFCYVLTSRQMGKSSLMVRTVRRLRKEGVAVAVLDLTAIGQNLTIEQWYDGLISRLGQQLDLEDELLAFWGAHPELGPLQRWVTSIEKVVLERIASRVVIFVDEIDIVRSLSFSTDEFFAAIREAYNRRSREPAFNRLAFSLLGVAAPTDLIRDTRMTPFNIGRRIELNDFTAGEAAPLARGLGPNEQAAGELLARVLYWTGGHPYLTQRLCRALADTLHPASPTDPPPTIPPVIPNARTVDQLADRLFLSRQARDRDDNLIFVRERILRSESDVAGLLYLYRRILNRELVHDDDTNPLITILRLSGIIRGVDGFLRVRNRIYARVFDLNWILTNMPQQEVRRQRTARRRGVLLGLAIAVILLLGYLVFSPIIARYREAQIAQRTIQRMEAAYRHPASYADTFESTVDIGVGGMTVQVRGSGSMLFEQPNKMHLVVKSDFGSEGMEVRITSDGRRAFIYAPRLKQFQVWDAPPPHRMFAVPPPLAQNLGPMRLLPLYRLVLSPPALDRLLADAQNIHFTENAELDGHPVRVITWEHSARPLLEGLGIPDPPSEPRIPVTVWVGTLDHRILQIRVDLSLWARQIISETREIQITALVLTEKHKTIQTSFLPSAAARFQFKPSEECRPVASFSVPISDSSTLSMLQRQFSKMIPPRLPQAPPNMIDLTEYYNAPLVKTWHPGMPDNSLDALPTGLLRFGDAVFDVRGIVQLSGLRLQESGGHYPQRVDAISVAQHCRQLHFLHACGWRAKDRTPIGTYVVHYNDGQERSIPIVYGEDVRDWVADSDPSANLKNASLVWSAMNNAKVHIRLFKTTWTNPEPEKEITSIDYISSMSEAAPFLIAITADP